MSTLKDLRNKHSISQLALSNATKIHQTLISSYEIGNTTPSLEEILTLQKHFGVSKIDFPEKLSAARKRDVIQAIEILMEKIPFESVISYCAKAIRQTNDFDNQIIKQANNLSSMRRITPLLPTGMELLNEIDD